jgi:hypothetical protein
MAVVGGGLGSLAIVVYWYRTSPAALQQTLQHRERRIAAAFRRLTWLWRQRRPYRALLSAAVDLWRAYAAWKRLALVGRIDLAIIQGTSAVSVAAVTFDLWDILGDIIRWLINRYG